jgi:hypothetical protein
MLEVQLTGKNVEFFAYFLENFDITIVINHVVVVAGLDELLPYANECVLLRFRHNVCLIK